MGMRFNFGDNIPYVTRFLDDDENPITDADGIIYIYRYSNKEYWNGATWQVARISLAMTEISETNQPGQWEFDFDSSVGEEEDQYIMEGEDDSGNSTTKPAILMPFVGGWNATLFSDIKRILGLDHENMTFEPTDFSTEGVATEIDVYLYDSKATTIADGRTIATGLIAKYHVDAPRSPSTGFLLKFTQTRETIS